MVTTCPNKFDGAAVISTGVEAKAASREAANLISVDETLIAK